MNITDFFAFNRECPLCQEPLTFYMQWIDANYLGEPDKLFVANRDGDLLQFNEHHMNSKQTGMYGQKIGDNKEIFFRIKNRIVDFNCQSSKKLLMSDSIMYFFAVCNPNGVEIEKNNGFKINIFEACYYRSSPYLKFIQKDKQTEVSYGDVSILNRDENFSIKHRTDDLLKVYIVSMNYEENKTNLWYYSATSEQENNKDFLPREFESEMPLLNNRPDLSQENRGKLIDRFDSWIIMS